LSGALLWARQIALPPAATGIIANSFYQTSAAFTSTCCIGKASTQHFCKRLGVLAPERAAELALCSGKLPVIQNSKGKFTVAQGGYWCKNQSFSKMK